MLERKKILFITISLMFCSMMVSAQQIKLHKISEDVAVLAGPGGNVTGVKTAEGVVVFDSFTNAQLGAEARQLLEKHFDTRVKYLVNTHHHADHTGGNAAFADVTILAHENNPKRASQLFAERYQKEIEAGTMKVVVANKTINETTTMEIGGKTFTFYYFGEAHTDNDLAVVIKEEKLLILEDLLFCGTMPYILHDHGSNVANWIEVLEFFKDNSQLYSRVIPGHGAVVTDEQGIVEAQRYLRYLWKSVVKAQREGKTLDQAKKEITLDIFKHLTNFERMLAHNIENCWRILEEG